LAGWRKSVKKLPSPLTITTASCMHMFNGYTGTVIPTLIAESGITITTCYYMFHNCRSVTEFDLSNLDLSNVTDVSYMFNNCTSATKIDIRTLDETKISVTTQMMYQVPSNCLIIVKDEAFKTWLKEKFSSLLNIKTVAEYEGN
jgi:surface protein